MEQISLPTELFHEIASHLRPTELIQLSYVCSGLYNVAETYLYREINSSLLGSDRTLGALLEIKRRPFRALYVRVLNTPTPTSPKLLSALNDILPLLTNLQSLALINPPFILPRTSWSFRLKSLTCGPIEHWHPSYPTWITGQTSLSKLVMVDTVLDPDMDNQVISPIEIPSLDFIALPIRCAPPFMVNDIATIELTGLLTQRDNTVHRIGDIFAQRLHSTSRLIIVPDESESWMEVCTVIASLVKHLPSLTRLSIDLWCFTRLEETDNLVPFLPIILEKCRNLRILEFISTPRFVQWSQLGPDLSTHCPSLECFAFGDVDQSQAEFIYREASAWIRGRGAYVHGH